MSLGSAQSGEDRPGPARRLGWAWFGLVRVVAWVWSGLVRAGAACRLGRPGEASHLGLAWSGSG